MANKNIRIALIPAYEPDFRLIELLEHVQEGGLIPIVINDGSGSRYTDIFAQAAGLSVVLTHTSNSGKGRAIKTGLNHIKKCLSEPFTVVTMDSDGQHRVADALRICEAAEEHPESLILGGRKFKENVPLRSRFGNTVTRLVYRCTTGLRIFDTQTGLRAFSSGLIGKMLEIPGERYEYEMNVLLEFADKKIPMKEIEIETIYIDNNSGSHFNTLKDSYRIYKEILKYSVSSFISFLIDYALFSLLSVLTLKYGKAGLTLSNIIARIISAGVNFSMNRRFVFKSKKSFAKSAIQYVILAAAILTANTLVLNVLVNQSGINQFKAKILTEILFFFLSWLTQHYIIFRKNRRGESI